MKKIKKICLLCFVFCIILLNYNVFGQTGTITGKSVRLREEATTDSKALTTMQKGEKVEILGEVDNWYNVNFEDKTGYVSKDYVKAEEEIADTTSEKVEEDNQEETSADSTIKPVEKENTNSELEQTISLGTEYTLQKNTKLRLKPNFSSIVLNTLNVGDKIIVNNKIGNWIEISISDKKGWILKNAIEIVENTTQESETIETEEQPVVGDTTIEPEEETTQENTPAENKATSSTTPSITKGYVNYKTVKVRKEPSTEGNNILGLLDLNDEVEIISEEGDWYKINTKEYGECYIAKRLISPTKVTSRGEDTQRTDSVSKEKNEELTSVLNNSSNSGSEIVSFANQYLGYKYVSGGKKPETGFDCSGFTKYVYSNFGVSLGATATSQANNSGMLVSREDLQPGDLILFQDDAKTKIGHCGIYIGNNTFIHAANPKRGVVTDKLEGNSYYSPRYVGAYRF